MRNQYPGTCYRCGKRVEAKAGHFERHNGGWRVQHAECAIKYRSKEHHQYRHGDENKPEFAKGEQSK